MQDRKRVTAYERLYQALRGLQAEIEEVLPDFEEQLDCLTSVPCSTRPDGTGIVAGTVCELHSDQVNRSSDEPLDPPPETIALHKHLLTLFTQYEHLSKRMSNLPSDEGGSQAQVQKAVARSAAIFLGKEMAKVQVSTFSLLHEQDQSSCLLRHFRRCRKYRRMRSANPWPLWRRR